MDGYVSGRQEHGLGPLRALGYSLVLVAGVSMGLARTLVESGRVTRITHRLRQVAGVLIIGVGGYFAYLAVK